MNKLPVYMFLIDGTYHIRCQSSRSLIHYISKIPSARYDTRGKYWVISGKDKIFVKEFCKIAESRLRYEVKELYDECTAKEMSDLMPDTTIPINAKIQPYEYQRKGIQYMITHKRCFNCDDMGTGKTAQSVLAIATAKAYPCLVVCPAAMKVTWQREFKRFAGKNAIILDDKLKTSWQNHFTTGTCNIFITNYESLKKYFVLTHRQITKKKCDIVMDPRISIFKSVIIDECHRCQENNTFWSKYLEKICKGKEYIFMLTGTPVVTDNKNLIQQLRIMGRLDDFGGEKVFRERYCQPNTSPIVLSELNYRLWETCYFRRDKSYVLKELPPKTRQYHVIDITNRDEYQSAEKNLIEFLKNNEKANDNKIAKVKKGQAIVQINVLRRLLADGKMQAAEEIINDYVQSKEKLIVFTAHKSIVSKLRQKFKDVLTITGDDSPDQKQRAIDKFQKDNSCLLIVINIKSGGVGITLTSSSNILFVEFPWTAADCDQCECRSHRNGQTKPVNIIYLLGKDTFDEQMYSIIQKERENSKHVTGSIDNSEETMVQKFMSIYT